MGRGFLRRAPSQPASRYLSCVRRNGAEAGRQKSTSVEDQRLPSPLAKLPQQSLSKPWESGFDGFPQLDIQRRPPVRLRGRCFQPLSRVYQSAMNMPTCLMVGSELVMSRISLCRVAPAAGRRCASAGRLRLQHRQLWAGPGPGEDRVRPCEAPERRRSFARIGSGKRHANSRAMPVRMAGQAGKSATELGISRHHVLAKSPDGLVSQ